MPVCQVAPFLLWVCAAPLSVQKEGMAPVALFAQDGEGPGLYFGKSNPIEQSKKEKFTVAKAVILKGACWHITVLVCFSGVSNVTTDGRCKCSGRSGRYFICQGTLAHYAKIFGLEKGKLIEMSDITNIKRLEEDVHVVHKGKGVVVRCCTLGHSPMEWLRYNL